MLNKLKGNNFSEMPKLYPIELKLNPFLGYLNHNNIEIKKKLYLDKININNYDKLNPYIGYINHAKLINQIKNLSEDKIINKDNFSDSDIKNIKNKFKVCNSLKNKNLKNIGIQCNLDSDGYDLIEEYNLDIIPDSAYLNLGKYLSDTC